MTTTLLIAFTIYIVALFAVSFIVGRDKDKEHFLIAGRNRPSWQILCSKFAGSVGVGWFVTYTAYAYEFGLGIFGVLFGFVIGYWLFAYWAAPKIRQFASKKQMYTQGDFVLHQTGSPYAAKLTNVVSIVMQYGLLLVGIVGGAKIIDHTGLMSYEVAVVLTTLIILGYISLAGFRAVVLTDAIQSVIILVLLAAIVFSFWGDVSFSEVMTAETNKLSVGSLVGFLLYGILAVFAFADRFQLSYAGKDRKAVSRGMFLALVPILLTASLLLYIGLYMVTQNSGLDPSLVFIEMMNTKLATSLLPFGIVLFFAGLMSSSDTALYAIVSHLTPIKKSTSPKKLMRQVMIMVVVIAAVSSLLVRDIVDITVVTAAITMTLSIPMIYLLKNKKNPHRFTGSIYGGIVGLVAGLFLLGPEPTLVLTVLFGGLVGLLRGRSKVVDTI